MLVVVGLFFFFFFEENEPLKCFSSEKLPHVSPLCAQTC